MGGDKAVIACRLLDDARRKNARDINASQLSRLTVADLANELIQPQRVLRGRAIWRGMDRAYW
jgi:hypothetical protein